VNPSDSNRNVSYDLFANPDSVDVSLILAGETLGLTVTTHLLSLAESRKDVVVFFSPNRSDVIDNSGNEASDLNSFVSSFTDRSTYAMMDSAWKYQYDKYNDTYRWVPLNGDVAGLCARTDNQRDPWFSPAGLNRGQIKNVIKLSWNPTKSERDTIYKIGVNPVVTFPGEGTILYGDKTFFAKPTAFDRINVRRLFIVLEKTIARAARSSLFEFNDEFTRSQFVNLVEPFLRDVQGRRGIYDFRVVCDTTNNTSEVIDRNEFIGDIYIKPARSINFIQLNFVAARTGVAFDEIVGRF
jgi:phage tail sheath protein FI